MYRKSNHKLHAVVSHLKVECIKMICDTQLISVVKVLSTCRWIRMYLCGLVCSWRSYVFHTNFLIITNRRKPRLLLLFIQWFVLLYCVRDFAFVHSLFFFTAYMKRVFGSFGLSTKGPYTVMNCPSSSLASSCISIALVSLSVHMVRHRNIIFGIQMHVCPSCMHINFLMIRTCSF